MKFANGPTRASIIAPGMMVPGTAKSSVFIAESPSCVPNGIASLSSTNGIIAVKKTISSLGMASFNYNSLVQVKSKFMVHGVWY